VKNIERAGRCWWVAVLVCALAGCGAREAAVEYPTLSLQLEPGMKWRVISTIRQELDGIAYGEEARVTVDEEFTFTVTHTGNENGVLLFAGEVARLKTQSIISSGNQSVTMQDIFGANPEQQLGRILMDFAFTMRVTPDHKVEVNGDFASIQDRIRRELNLGPNLDWVPGGAKIREEAIEEIAASIKPEYIRARFEPVLTVARGQALEPGAAFAEAPTVSILHRALGSRSVAYKESTERGHVFTQSSVFIPDPDYPGAQLSGGGTGTILVDAATGMGIDFTHKVSLRGTAAEAVDVHSETSERIEVFRQ
jgi:hypothetical protein